MEKKYLDLQSLRAIACFLVVLLHIHCCESASPSGRGLLRFTEHFAFAGVDLFFALSGFIITFAHYDKLGKSAELKSYLVKRIWRIYPLYWTCFFLFMFLAHVVFAAKIYPGFTRINFYFALLLPRDRWNNLILQAWTLEYEMTFYLAFAVFFLVPRRYFLPILFAWFSVVACCSIFFFPTMMRNALTLVVRPLSLEFLFGSFAAVALRKGWNWRPQAVLVLGVAWFITAAAIGVAGMTTANVDNRPRVLLFGIPSALILYGLTSCDLTGSSLLPRWLQPIGNASYSIYLTHIAVLTGFIQFGILFGTSTLQRDVFLIFVQFATCIAVGYLFYRLIEKPLLNLRAKPAKIVAVPPRQSTEMIERKAA
ncbi:MAG: acyltransferase [Planctomycetes bacterium]|nr:acyltransferase [Planctomycetota bacterium]